MGVLNKINKDLSKWVNFCVAILILKMEEKKQHFRHIVLYYFKKGKNTLKRKKKICALYGEGAVTDQTCQSGLRSFVLEISCWTMLHGQVDQLKLLELTVL